MTERRQSAEQTAVAAAWAVAGDEGQTWRTDDEDDDEGGDEDDGEGNGDGGDGGAGVPVDSISDSGDEEANGGGDGGGGGGGGGGGVIMGSATVPVALPASNQPAAVVHEHEAGAPSSSASSSLWRPAEGGTDHDADLSGSANGLEHTSHSLIGSSSRIAALRRARALRR